MVTDNLFYNNFRDSIIGLSNSDIDGPSKRVTFMLHQFKLIPQRFHKLFCNITRAYPTPPVYAFIGLGSIGTNISRYSVVSRIGSHRTQTERVGSFYKLIAPSRLGKGIAISIISDIGNHIQNLRSKDFDVRVSSEPQVNDDLELIPLKQFKVLSLQKRPRIFFLTGGNALQTQTAAANNAGCGLLLVPEIKSGKCRYTDTEGKYAPLLSFYDDRMSGETFRKAEDIPMIPKCQIHLVAAGVKEDWIPFVQKTGMNSGYLARVMPILCYDREVIRLQQDKLPAYSFSLDGLKKAFGILETKFSRYTAKDSDPSLTLEFTDSAILDTFRSTNNELILDFIHNDNTDLSGIFTTLLNATGPTSDTLLEEGSGVGRLRVFFDQTVAEFSAGQKNPGDNEAICGLETNLLRVASDYFWTSFICSFLNNHGVLSTDEEARLKLSIDQLILNKVSSIPDYIVEPLLKFMRYTLLSSLHLNRLAVSSPNAQPVIQPQQGVSIKRHRIVTRLSEGYTALKRRKFYICKVHESLGDCSKIEIEDQIRILVTRVVVTKPTTRTVELQRTLSAAAQRYLISDCGFTQVQLAALIEKSALLID